MILNSMILSLMILSLMILSLMIHYIHKALSYYNGRRPGYLNHLEIPHLLQQVVSHLQQVW
jgi:hypothetical protein